MLDPIELTKQIEPLITKNLERKYYRLVRGGRWYGGIASSDCSGCNLRCVFCWSNDAAREGKLGKFYSPDKIFRSLLQCAEKHGYRQVRISGNEPTLAREHLLKLIELFEGNEYKFILETNGILLGYDRSYAKELAKFKCLEVRVSIKGTNEEEFSRLTRAKSEAFNLQLKALENLLDYNVSCYPAVMLSFSPQKNYEKLLGRLENIDKSLAKEVDEEYVILYPHVIERLKKANIRPLIAYTPNNVPVECI